MKKKDYTKFSNHQPKVEPVPVATEEHVASVTTLEFREPAEAEVAKTLKGTVSGCAKLNVREEANLFAEVVGQLNKGAEVAIDELESTEDFYKIYTASGMAGFCMKKFVTLLA